MADIGLIEEEKPGIAMGHMVSLKVLNGTGWHSDLRCRKLWRQRQMID